MTRLANFALTALIAGLLAIASTVTVIPAVTGTRPVSIIAGSMTGTYDYGTLLLVAEDREPAVGDVITWKIGEQSPVSHRVMAIETDPSGNGIQYRTRGDANKTDDPQPVSPDYVVGVATGSIPLAGMATNLLGQLPVQVFTGSLALGLYWLADRKPREPERLTLAPE